MAKQPHGCGSLLRVSVLLAAVEVDVTATGPPEVERWNVAEWSFHGPGDALGLNPFTDVTLAARFTRVGSPEVLVQGFYDGQGIGNWASHYAPPRRTFPKRNLPNSNLQGQTGWVMCTAASSRGPVVASKENPRSFIYGDGSPHFSVGTTAYAWAHVDPDQATKTLATLSGGPFNKIRMTVFPKCQPEPCHICCPSMNGNATFDFTRPNVAFWQRYEGYITSLRDLEIVADLILFHGYDGEHWGFDCMGMQ
eukprot:gene4272-4563_t